MQTHGATYLSAWCDTRLKQGGWLRVGAIVRPQRVREPRRVGARGVAPAATLRFYCCGMLFFNASIRAGSSASMRLRASIEGTALAACSALLRIDTQAYSRSAAVAPSHLAFVAFSAASSTSS